MKMTINEARHYIKKMQHGCMNGRNYDDPERLKKAQALEIALEHINVLENVALQVSIDGKKDANGKPPIGLMPSEVFEIKCNQERIHDISSAIVRYCDACEPVRGYWLTELESRIKRISELSGNNVQNY